MANGLFFGDSITFGEYDGELGGWVDILKRYSYHQFYHHDASEVNIFNLGIGGENTDGLIKRLQVELEARKSSEENLIFFSYGANDLVINDGKQEVPLERFEQNLERAVLVAKNITDHIYLIEIIPVAERLDGHPNPAGRLRSNQEILKYNAATKAFAVKNSLQYISLYDDFFLNKEEYLSKDGVHPNSKGYRYISEKIKPIIEKLL